eukprot:jgi/Chrpa1/13223/Chrysochromulina_OHIO_Genome00023924-RA
MAASTAALPPCLDRHEQCHMWAQIGECEVAAFMALNCPVSCGHACLTTPGTPSDSQARQQVVMLGARSDERIDFPGPRQAIAEMHAGELHLVLRLASGVVLTFGDDSMGQLGSPRIARATPVTRRPPRRVFWPPPYTHLRAVAVGAGRMTSGALLSDGSLIVFGDNSRGQCGVPPEQTPMDPAPPELDALSLIVAVPMRVPFPRAIAAFSLGEVHSLILTTDGEVWSFGDGSFGATCNGTEPFHSRVVPEQFGLCELGLHEGERIVSLVAGAFHSTVLTSNDRVLVWGDNTHGQLGASRKSGYVYSSLHEAQRRGSEDVDEDELQAELERAQTISEMTLPRIAGEGFVKLTSRAFHSAAITDAGRLLLWGDNGYGQLGIEPANHSAVGQSDFAVPLGPAVGFFARQVALGELHSLVLDNASRIFSFGSNTRHELHRMRGASFDAFPQPTARLPLATDETIELLAAGAHFGAVTSSHGHVYIWGEPPLAADPRSMYAPREHDTSTVAAGVSAAGVVTAAPFGAFGGGGAADVDNDAIDGAGASGGGAGGRARGSEAEGALSAISEVTLSPEGTRAVAVCAGGFHSAALSADGTVFTWGENAAQQLCRGSEDQIDPLAAPLDPPPPRARSRPRGEQPDVTVADESRVLLGCGPFSTLVHVRGEALHTCGDAMDGISSLEPPQSQPEPPPPPPAPAFGGAIRIGASEKRPSTASTASRAATPMTTPKGVGAGRDAPDTAPRLRAVELPGWVPTEDPLVALSCGHAHTLALSRAGRLFAWGSNEYGQLGYGEAPPMGSPEATAPLPPRELIILHEPQQPAPSSRQRQQQEHEQQQQEEEQGRPSVGAAAAATAEGRAGSNLNRRVLEDNVYVAPGAHVSIDKQTLETALEGGEVSAAATISEGDGVAISEGDGVTISEGDGFTISEGDGVTISEGDGVAPEPADGSAALETGTSAPERVAAPFSRLLVRAVAAGGHHTLVLGEDGQVRSFGCNSHGQLARPSTETLPIPPDPRPIRLPAAHKAERAVAIAAGLYHSLVLLQSGALCSFGDHSHGQLGRRTAHRANACSVGAGELPHSGNSRGGSEDAPSDEPLEDDEGETDEADEADEADEVDEVDEAELALPMGPVTQIAAGEMHSLALTATGEVWSWGDNMLQQCARSLHVSLLPTPGRVPLPLHEGERVVSISAAGYHGAALTSLGRVFNLGTSGISSLEAAEEEEGLLDHGFDDEGRYEDDAARERDDPAYDEFEEDAREQLEDQF